MYMILQLVANKVGHSNFGHPIFTKEINANAWPFLGKYRVTKVVPLCLQLTVYHWCLCSVLWFLITWFQPYFCVDGTDPCVESVVTSASPSGCSGWLLPWCSSTLVSWPLNTITSHLGLMTSRWDNLIIIINYCASNYSLSQ